MKPTGKNNDLLITIFRVFLGALILSVVAFYNGYPLVTPDTGAYITQAYDNQLPRDRPPFYGWFILIGSLSHSLWFVIFLQTAILSWLLYEFTGYLNATLKQTRYFVVMVGMMAAFTSSAWIGGQLMPDIFTPILLLASVLFLLTSAGQKFKLIILAIVIVIAVLVHNSHYMVLTMVSILLTVYSFFRKNVFIKTSRAVTLVLLSASCWIILGSIHAAKGYGFSFSRSTHVFMMGKLAESGILTTYLYDNCGQKGISLCNHIDDIPSVAWEFVWEEWSPLYKTGGWDSSKREYNKILHDVFTSPKYLRMFATKSAISTFRQLTQVQVLLEPQGHNSNTWHAVNRFYQHEVREYLYSGQNLNTLAYKPANQLHLLFFIGSTVWLLLFFPKIPDNRKIAWVYGLILLFIVVNAFATATFANVLYRLQNRIFWVLPATNIIIMLHYYTGRYFTATTKS